jgi:lysine-ketoglutarate reductase/saccharopine dehydrogenase-like protein (TIGR00300 family)
MEAETVEVKGHIIDSLILPKILDEIMNYGGSFEILEIKIGQRREEPSYAKLRVTASSRMSLDEILARIKQHGAVQLDEGDVRLMLAEQDGVLPDGFYATTNLDTYIRYRGQWIPVERPEMDSGILFSPETGRCRTIKMNQVKKGQLIASGHQGIKVIPHGRSAPERNVFEFMASSVSSEKPKGIIIKEIAAQIRSAKQRGQKILVVGGPAIVHTGATPHLVRMIEAGWVDILFAGNALAAHDIEQALFGTSLGVYTEKGVPAVEGHENHLRAINLIRKQGGIRKAVEAGVLSTGIMHACVVHGVPFVLAGSIRDDGPLPEVIANVVAAQEAMRAFVPGVGISLMIATMLHAVAVGNMLPASVKTICIDINPAVVTKLSDRGSFQAMGLVTDVEPFMRELWEHLKVP